MLHILSDCEKDHKTSSKPSGSYEWWYFDAVSDDGNTALVIIFYEGIPFSPEYNRMIKNGAGNEAHPEEHPAVSISVYHHGKPVYYSLTEYRKKDVTIKVDPWCISIGEHQFYQNVRKNELSYQLTLREQLPDGDSIEADLNFTGLTTAKSLLDEGEGVDHVWNLVQPSATVNGSLKISGFRNYELPFSGSGYHDHNYGEEPMKHAFREWYWGRVHFPEATLVYYVMNGLSGKQHRAWLIDRDNQKVVTGFSSIYTDEPQLTRFGLRPCRRLKLQSAEIKADIYHSRPVDNGPFYIRYLCDAVLHVPEWGLQKQSGISEYIYPGRIDHSVFRPLIHMRYRYANSKPHWVQKSPRLYRWTW